LFVFALLFYFLEKNKHIQNHTHFAYLIKSIVLGWAL